MKISLFSHTHESFSESVFNQIGKGKQHAGIIYEEILRKGTPSPHHPIFKNAPQLYEKIMEMTDWSIPEISDRRDDGITGKFLLKTHDNLEIESVLIPMRFKGTLCLSSQVGCRMGCVFCETGRMGLLRNLTTEEIIGQVFAARFRLNFDFRNIVFMGMGEPFDNYEEVLRAARILMDPKGFGLGRKNITISTSGRIEEIKRFTREGSWAPNLAVSINAPNDKMRNRLMPINRKNSMKDLYEALLEYNHITGREIWVAYVLMQGKNDSLEHAEQLAHYLKGLKVKVNLIPYNHQSCDRFKAPEISILYSFAKILNEYGFYTFFRLTKGSRIMAACGQLGNLALRERKKLETCELESFQI